MAFWDKFFKKNNIDTNVPLPQVQNIEEKTYQVLFSLSTEEEQSRVKDFIRPITDKWQVMNLIMGNTKTKVILRIFSHIL